MNPETTRIGLDITQLLAIGGLVWGIARMSKSVDMLKEMYDKGTAVVQVVVRELAELSGRVLVLEDRTGRRTTDVRR